MILSRKSQSVQLDCHVTVTVNAGARLMNCVGARARAENGRFIAAFLSAQAFEKFQAVLQQQQLQDDLFHLSKGVG